MLSAILSQSLFHFLLVFCRMGAAIMMMPGVAAKHVPAQVRIIVALGVTLVVTPVVSATLPPQPDDVMSQSLLVAGELVIGLFLGAIVDIILSALHVAGTIISFQGGFANAMIFDPITEQQGSVITGLLDTVAITLIVVTDAHHLFLRAAVDSYTLFMPGVMPDVIDMTSTIVRQTGESFLLGFKLAAPFIVFTVVLHSALGVMSKLAPQIQVFFVFMPLQVLMSIALFSIVLPGLMMWFLRYYERAITPFLAPG
jgi:flagellar biosynthetic protein FliR